MILKPLKACFFFADKLVFHLSVLQTNNKNIHNPKIVRYLKQYFLYFYGLNC